MPGGRKPSFIRCVRNPSILRIANAAHDEARAVRAPRGPGEAQPERRAGGRAPRDGLAGGACAGKTVLDRCLFAKSTITTELHRGFSTYGPYCCR